MKNYHNRPRFHSFNQARAVMALLLAVAFAFPGTNVAFAQTAAQAGGQSQKKAPGRAVSKKISSGQVRRQKTSAHSSTDTAKLARGAALHKEGRVDEAEAIFREVLAGNPRCVDAFYDLGAIAEGRGDMIGALSSYRAALALRPGDKELLDAVASTEAALKKSALTNKLPPLTPAKQDGIKEAAKESPMGASPPSSQDRSLDSLSQSGAAAGGGRGEDASGETAASYSAPAAMAPSNLPDFSQPLSQQLSQAQADCRDPDKTDQPVFSVPQSDAPPLALDGGKTFSLSSRKGALVAPSVGVPLNQSDVPRLGITPDQFPEPGTLKSSTSTGICPPPAAPSLTASANQNTGTSNLRRGAALLLMVGAGTVLGGSLHCPICHMLHF